jgi:hypothetical protein
MFQIHFTAFWRDKHLDLDPGFSGMTIHPLPPPPQQKFKPQSQVFGLKATWSLFMDIHTPQEDYNLEDSGS